MLGAQIDIDGLSSGECNLLSELIQHRLLLHGFSGGTCHQGKNGAGCQQDAAQEVGRVRGAGLGHDGL